MTDLYGKLNTTKIQKEYTGVETQTAEVLVDNDTNTIRVNVKELQNLIARVEELERRLGIQR